MSVSRPGAAKGIGPSMPEADHATHVEAAANRARPLLIIVDGDGRVLVDSIEATQHELRLLLDDDRTAFRGELALAVRTLIEQSVQTGERHSRIASLDTHRFVRVTRLNGNGGCMFAVSVEHFRGGDSLSRAARKYRLTPREMDVLAMILEGANATETAVALNIAETTVQGYYKRLLNKTQSRNRPAMVANVLDWRGSDRRR